jgi:DHA2 family multidrug resistance protein-like MFS transporter
MAVLDGAIANVALPTIASDLNASPAASIWIVNAYQIAIVIALLPLSFLGDMFGYRRIYKIGLVVFIFTSLACALSRSLEMLTLPASRRVWRRGADERQHRADPPDLSAALSGSRHGD